MVSALFMVAAFAPNSTDPIVVDGMLCHPERLLVKLDSLSNVDKLRLPGVSLVRTIPEINYAVVRVKKGQLRQNRAKIKRLSGILNVEYDKASQLLYEPNDPLWPQMWHMTAIKANLAWDLSFGSNASVVAVIDTGVNVAHPDLAANIWVNPGEIPGNGIDDDGNGYADDVNGYDFAYNDSVPNDVNGHGTACAGLVGAVQDNGIGVTGVAPRTRIMAIKAALDNGFFYDSATVPAYVYCGNLGVKVFSMSYFSDRVTQAEKDAMDYAVSRGVLPVAAAGNSASVIPYYPAAYENVLSVAALATDLSKASFSNFGSWVDVSAPGVSLRTTTTSGGYTSSFSGTSGACPHVAGLAGLLFGANPAATAQQVRAAIEDTATPQNQAPFGEFSNYGLINCQAAMAAILGTPATKRSPVVRWMNALGQQLNEPVYLIDAFVRPRIYGRGFQTPGTLEVTIGGQPVPIVARTRDYIDIQYTPPILGDVRVYVDGAEVSSFVMPNTYRTSFPLTEASSPSASVIGGFFDSLRPDGVELRCTRRSDGKVRMEGVFRKVNAFGRVELVFRRRYTAAGAASTERVYLYDWSSGSYPYGNWVQQNVTTTPTSLATAVIPVSNLANYIDPEGTMYVLVETTTDMPSGAELRIDQLGLNERP